MVEVADPETTCKISELPQMAQRAPARPTATETDRTMADRIMFGKGAYFSEEFCLAMILVAFRGGEVNPHSLQQTGQSPRKWMACLAGTEQGAGSAFEGSVFSIMGKYNVAGKESLLNGRVFLL